MPSSIRYIYYLSRTHFFGQKLGVEKIFEIDLSFVKSVYDFALSSTTKLPPPRRHHYFDVVVGLAWSYDPESYAACSVAAGRVSHAGQVKGDDPYKMGYPGPSGWGLGVGLTAPPRKTL
jgi:hypothetical protein